MTNWAGTMTQRGTLGILAVCIALTMLSSCGRNSTATSSEGAYLDRDNVGNPIDNSQITGTKSGSTIWDIFGPFGTSEDPPFVDAACLVDA